MRPISCLHKNNKTAEELPCVFSEKKNCVSSDVFSQLIFGENLNFCRIFFVTGKKYSTWLNF